MNKKEALEIVERLDKEILETKNTIIKTFGLGWDSDDPMENCRTTPIYSELKMLERIRDKVKF